MYFKDGRYWKENRIDFQKDNSSTFGIFSLSAVKDNLLMWSHYSNSHTGFCIAFDADKPLKLSSSLGKVLYDNVYPEINLFDNSTKNFLRFFITKSNDWEYEAEYRI